MTSCKTLHPRTHAYVAVQVLLVFFYKYAVSVEVLSKPDFKKKIHSIYTFQTLDTW